MKLEIQMGTPVLTYEEIPYGALFQEEYEVDREDAMIRMKVKAGHPYFEVTDKCNPRGPGHDICISVWRRNAGEWSPEFKWFLPPIDHDDDFGWQEPRRFHIVSYTLTAER